MKLSRLLLISAVAISLTSCDDLFEPALENNQDISQMYKDPQFARGILDNAYLALPYSTAPSTDVLPMMLSPTTTLITTKRWLQVLGLQI